AFSLTGQSGQITVPRVELMPNQPAQYNIRDWRQVALRYDSFVYDATKTGQYLPLVNIKANGFNYPQNQSFGLHTYVGTTSPQNGEAINVLPSLVSATLAGTNKTSQNGQNWVLMSQDYFNKNNGELIYLNNPNTSSGNDWWYDLMPNVFFYQLYDLYPNVGGDAEFQFHSIADRFAEAVRAMGGSDAPWQKTYMNYRAWNFKTKQPNTTSVPEPEAAGAYAWVLYNAYHQIGNPEYLKAAEWSLEFLSEWPNNPSYELQLPYGTYTAARMNAELGTRYDVEKMVNWSFDRGALRGWGTIVGNWGGYSVSGLVGEANDGGNDYAFQLNGVQQAAALVPMVRYDKRFARAIGKWMMNLTSATRLFYPGFLSASRQDATAWSNAHDPDHVLGYEALKEKYQNLSPYSTGDALGGGWSGTNLSLYSTSSIGYLGSIVEKTNVDRILKINVLKTDFYKNTAYPTYLFFNPYPQTQAVEIAVGTAPVDIYDAISGTFLLQGVTGTVNLYLPANQARLVTLAPAGGTVTYDKNKMLINGVVVDYAQTAQPFTYAPRIQGLAPTQSAVEFGDSTTVFGTAFDQDSGDLTWTWSVSGGQISGSGPTVQWLAPNTTGNYTLTAIVTDDTGQKDTATVMLHAVAEINLAPQIMEIQKSALYVAPGGSISVTANASDANGDPLTYTWTTNGGTINGTGNLITWNAPAAPGIFQIKVVVADDQGLSAQGSTNILVKNFTATPGTIIAHYPFSGNANDISGHQLHGQTSGGVLFVPDFWGNPLSAGRFDGVNDKVTVLNSPLLNFQQGITVSAWFKPLALPARESFMVSHGSWQNRWKISITPDHKIRWTVNTLTTIADLDSDQAIAVDSVYH
ncbi:MAG: laminin G, partial [Saprospiraceae bacterium]|nr:laminin G [Saprospiraceae bacterium]